MTLLFVLMTPQAHGGDVLPVALEKARRALVHHDDHAANLALQDAEEALAEAAMLVPGTEVARLLYLRGVRAWAGGLQSLAMTEWRRMWRLESWDPGDDGLLDDEGISVLRALRSETSLPEVPVSLVGDLRGVLVLADGAPLAAKGSLPEGRHLLQVRCGDGSLKSAWTELSEPYSLTVGCPRRAGKAGGVNDPVLAEDADADLVRVALFGAYTADAAVRLSQLPSDEAQNPTKEPPKVEEPPKAEAPPEAEAPPKAAEPPPEAALAHVEPPSPEPLPAPEPPSDLLTCPGTTVFSGLSDDPAWRGSLPAEPSAGGARATAAGVRWFPQLPEGDLSIRVEGEGSFGVRVRYDPASQSGYAARVNPKGVDLVALPDSVVVGRWVPTDGPRVLRVDVRQGQVIVRLDDMMVLGGVAQGVTEGSVAVEAEPGAWLGRVSVCQ